MKIILDTVRSICHKGSFSTNGLRFMMSWIFRYLTVMFYGWLYSGVSTARHMGSVRKLKTGTATLAPMFPFGNHCQCHDPPRQIREASDLLIVLLRPFPTSKGSLSPNRSIKSRNIPRASLCISFIALSFVSGPSK